MRLPIILLCFIASSAFAQLDRNYTPQPLLDTIPKQTFELLHARREAAKALIPDPKSKVSVFAKKLYDDNYDYVVQIFNDDEFISDGLIVDKLRSISTKILAANPDITSDISIYVHRTSVPNAFTTAGGTIAITLGLVNRLQTEDQMAFTICHEMAHHYGRHMEQRILEQAKLNYDKDIRKQLRSIARSEYGVVSKTGALSRKLGMSVRQHSRDKEYEADSVGLQLYLKSGYDPREAIRLLQVLDSSNYTSQASIDVKKHFNSEPYTFKDKWLAYDSTADGFQREDVVISDSLLTHPDCKKRIIALQRQLREGNNQDVSPKPWPNEVRSASKFELVESAFHYSQYSLAAFKALSLLDEYPDNEWLHGIVSKSLINICALQKAHQASRALPLPAPYYSASYNRFLAFLHNLRLSEMEMIASNYKTHN